MLADEQLLCQETSIMSNHSISACPVPCLGVQHWMDSIMRGRSTINRKVGGWGLLSYVSGSIIQFLCGTDNASNLLLSVSPRLK